MRTDSMILAIDPGKSGGLALWTGDGINCTKMPDTLGDLALRLTALPDDTVVVMEQVTGFVKGRGGQPGSAMFKFGEGYGYVQGVCAARGLRLELVTPQRWQKGLGLTGGGDDKKRYLKEAAQRLFPKQKVTLKTCDALLILEWALTRRTV